MSEEITPLTQPRAGAALEGSGGTWRGESSAPIRYPDPDIVVLDPRFQPMVLGNAAIERVATGFRFTEGPAKRSATARSGSPRWRPWPGSAPENEVATPFEPVP